MQCRHFPECGGCTLLDYSYNEQMSIKSQDLEELFGSTGVLQSPIPAKQTEGFRSKIQLPFGLSRRGQPIIGCYSPGTHHVVDQFECPVQDNDANALLRAVRSWVRQHQLSVYDEKTGQGFLRYIVMRECLNSQEILLGLITTSQTPADDEDMAADLWDYLKPTVARFQNHDLVGCVRHINDKKGNYAFDEKEILWWGREYAQFDLGPYSFKAHLSTFFQIHLDQAEILFSMVRDLIPPQSKVLELYSGIGALSMFVGEKAADLLGVEISATSVAAAREAAEVNEMEHCRFEVGDSSDAIGHFKDFDTLIVDPPRKGLGDSLAQALAEKGPANLIYISCNPKSLHKDAQIFGDKYKLAMIRGIDLFPHTPHLEVLSFWQRK